MEVSALKDWWLPDGMGFEEAFGRQVPRTTAIESKAVLMHAAPTLDGMKQVLTRLEAARQKVMPVRSVRALLTFFETLASRWLQPAHSERQQYLRAAADLTGRSPAFLAERLDLTLRALRAPLLEQFLLRSLRLPDALDGFVLDPARGLRTHAFGPALMGVRAASGPPDLALLAVARGLLLKSAVLVQVSEESTRETALLLPLFFSSASRLDSAISSCVAVVTGLEAEADAQAEVFNKLDHLTVLGGYAELRQVQAVAPPLLRVDGFAGGVSLTVVLKSALKRTETLNGLVAGIARDFALAEADPHWGPRAILVEQGGLVSIRAFAQALSDAMAELNLTLPPSRLSTARRTELRNVLAMLELRMAMGEAIQLVSPASRLQGAVVIEPPSSLESVRDERTIRVMPFLHRHELVQRIEADGRALQCLVVAGDGFVSEQIRSHLAGKGARLFCAPGQMYQPLFAWHRLGGPNLSELVRWTDEDLSLSLEEVETVELEEVMLTTTDDGRVVQYGASDSYAAPYSISASAPEDDDDEDDDDDDAEEASNHTVFIDAVYVAAAIEEGRHTGASAQKASAQLTQGALEEPVLEAVPLVGAVLESTSPESASPESALLESALPDRTPFDARVTAPHFDSPTRIVTLPPELMSSAPLPDLGGGALPPGFTREGLSPPSGRSQAAPPELAPPARPIPFEGEGLDEQDWDDAGERTRVITGIEELLRGVEQERGNSAPTRTPDALNRGASSSRVANGAPAAEPPAEQTGEARGASARATMPLAVPGGPIAASGLSFLTPRSIFGASTKPVGESAYVIAMPPPARPATLSSPLPAPKPAPAKKGHRADSSQEP